MPHFGVVRTGIWTIAEVTNSKRGLESTETEVNVQECGLGLGEPKPSQSTAPVQCSMCVNDLFQFGAVAVHTLSTLKAIWYGLNVTLCTYHLSKAWFSYVADVSAT